MMMQDSVTRQEEERRKVDAHFKELATVLLHRSLSCDADSLITRAPLLLCCTLCQPWELIIACCSWFPRYVAAKPKCC